MATSTRFVLPDRLTDILSKRGDASACPASVMQTIKSIPYFSAKPSSTPSRTFDQGATQGSRFGNLDRYGEDWRGNGSSQGRYGAPQDRNGFDRRRMTESDEGFEVWNGHRRRGEKFQNPSQFRQPYANTAPSDSKHAERPAVSAAVAPATNTVAGAGTATDSAATTKFSFAAVKSAAAVEDRMLARVKGKINKIGPSTYEATKVFMQQILDSNEPGFLDDFMKFVFQKAATESTFCSLYAKLLHELADEFTHIRTVMCALFRDYIDVFKNVEDSPDKSQSEYIGFVNDQERKKFRRGYSQFVAELVKLGEANIDDFKNLVYAIVHVLEENYNKSDKMLLCEEFIDCLATLCKSASSIMTSADWAETMKARLEVVVKKQRSDASGLTNKGRFALMDLVESASKGWK